MLNFTDASDIRKTSVIFCGLIAFVIGRTFFAQCRYYKWFRTSKFEMARRTGFGQSACKAYGVIPNPPALSYRAFVICGVLLLGALLGVCTDFAPRFCLALSLVLYWVFYAQLYCEAHVGAHVTVLVPTMLLICLLSPSLTTTKGELSPALETLPILVLKMVITSAYCSAGLSKLLASVRSGQFWGDGATLQYYIFEAMMVNRKHTAPGTEALAVPHFSFGVPTPFSYHFQEFLLRSPRLCAMLSVKSLAFEALAPLVLLFPQMGMFFAVAGVGFHYGIALFQNIDFVSWWGPFYVLFAFENTAVSANMVDVISQSLVLAPVTSTLSITYLVLHIVAMFYVAKTGHEILPFSSFHMFSEPKNLCSETCSKHWWITDKQHAVGTLKNYAFPFCRRQHVMVEELQQLPFKYLYVGYDAVTKSNRTFGNVNVSARLQDLIEKMRVEWTCGSENYLLDASITRIHALLEAAKEELASVSHAGVKQGASVMVGG